MSGFFIFEIFMEETNCILSTAYWGPVQYFTKIYKYNHILIEQYETYPKQTYRNRCNIYGPNGVQSLNVPVQKGSFHKFLTKDIKISYDTDWQKNHLKSIEAAYKSSPFYDYYIDDILPLYVKRHQFLLDLNQQILETCYEWLCIEQNHNYTDDYLPDYDFGDFREGIHPKPSKNLIDTEFNPTSYIQGFEQRFGFIANLSILDLIFNSGTEAFSIIKASIKE